MAIHARNEAYKQKVLRAPYEICIERARCYTEVFKRTEGLHPALRAARAFEQTLRRMSIYILDEEAIVGNRSSKLVGTTLPIERGDANTVLAFDLDLLQNRPRQPYRIAPDDERELRNEILPYWKGKTLRDRKNRLWRKNGLYVRPALHPGSLLRRVRGLDLRKLRAAFAVPRRGLLYAIQGIRELLLNNPALVMNVFDIQGHLILGNKTILREGFAGVQQRAAAGLHAAQQQGDGEAAAFLEAVICCCEAIRAFAARFADKAEVLADSAADPQRRQELRAIAARCRRVPYHPPRDFREAVQALWFNHVGACIAYGMPGIFAVGRLDQHLYPFYRQDKDAGTLTDEEAVALLEELLIKFSYNLLLLPYTGKNTANELGADNCALTVGGVDAAGEDAVNDLSSLILDAFTNVKSLGNSFSIRLSRRNPVAFWRKAMATYRQTSGAALFCDEVIVAALQGCGVKTQDARDYGVIGCVEPTSDGNTFGCTSGNDISLTAALEMTLLDGYLRIMGRRIGPRTGDPRRFQTFAQFMEAYKRQVDFMVETVVKATNLKDQAYWEAFPCPYVSATLRGCVEHARDMTRGGAQYNFGSVSARGIGTAVDSLAAIRHFVYDQKSLTMDQLVRMLDGNFQGCEIMRARLAGRGPKYGCDDDYADRIAVEVAEHFCRTVAAHPTIRGGPYRPSFFSYGMHVLEGLFLGATPNGRRAGEPVSNSFSPANGSEKHGPTALLRSLAKIDHTLISNGCSVNLKLLPQMFRDDEQLDKMTALVQCYFEMGGMELQPNVLSNETLRAAQADPEQYRDLVVRVSGYSALFTDLGRPLQDEIIRRTEFGAP